MSKPTLLHVAPTDSRLCRRLAAGGAPQLLTLRGRDMKRHFPLCIKAPLALLLILFLASGCGSTDEHASQANAGGYYGVGYSDPWYYGDTHYPPDVIVTPPRPVDPPHVEHPIALPPSGPVATPLPSIPSVPRVAPRR